MFSMFWNSRIRIPLTNYNVSLSNVRPNAKYVALFSLGLLGWLTMAAANEPELTEAFCSKVCEHFGFVSPDQPHYGPEMIMDNHNDNTKCSCYMSSETDEVTLDPSQTGYGGPVTVRPSRGMDNKR